MKDDLFQAIAFELNQRIDFISSKYFSKKKHPGVEIRNIDKAISDFVMKKYMMYVKTAEINDFKDTIIRSGDCLGIWPEMPLVTEARGLGPKPYDVTRLPFPLDGKQMIIISRLLYHPLEASIFITTGVGGSGKSTYLNLIRYLFDNDCSNASLTSLSNEFNVAEAVKHRLICSDEIGKGSADEEMLKKISAKNPMLINPKNKTPYEVRSQSSIFYCCNKEPVLDITDSGILRRIVYYRRDTPIKNPIEGMDSQGFTHDQCLEVARQAMSFDVGESGNKWKDRFLIETHDSLRKNLNVHRFRNCACYEQYATECKNQGLKAYSQPRWEEIRILLDEWQKEDNKIMADVIDML